MKRNTLNLILILVIIALITLDLWYAGTKITELTDHSKIEMNGVSIRCVPMANGMSCWTTDRQTIDITSKINITLGK